MGVALGVGADGGGVAAAEVGLLVPDDASGAEVAAVRVGGHALGLGLVGLVLNALREPAEVDADEAFTAGERVLEVAASGLLALAGRRRGVARGLLGGLGHGSVGGLEVRAVRGEGDGRVAGLVGLLDLLGRGGGLRGLVGDVCVVSGNDLLAVVVGGSVLVVRKSLWSE